MANKNNNTQRFMLEPEAHRHFGIKARTYKRWIEEGEIIPGRMKVVGSNYYVIDPSLFEPWFIETKLQPATAENKVHSRKPIKQQTLIITKKEQSYGEM